MEILLRDRQVESIAVAEAVDLIRTRAHYVRWYDALPSGDPDKLELLDLAFPAFLGAVPNFKALFVDNGWESIYSALQIASDLLRRIPTDIPLENWDRTNSRHALLVDLFRTTTGGQNKALPGFGPARCTKMLHKKRPALIPILDSWQLEAWDKPTGSWRTDDMADVVFGIRDKIVPQVSEFYELAERLKRADPSLPCLSAVRLYDILFWEMSVAHGREDLT